MPVSNLTLVERIARVLAGRELSINAEGVDPWALLSEEKEEKPELPSNTTAPDLAAWTALSRVVLNLDEKITKE